MTSNTDTAYSAFNMGGGESSVISLLYLLHRMPRGGLLVVEEIEAGLHPQAQVRLAQALIKTYLDKQIQVICSTHSESFLDALPRQARLLMRRMGEDHTVLESPSTRFAVYEMTGEFQPELVVYCEDVFAATMVQEALPHDLRIRLRVQDVGSNATVIRQGVSHLRSGLGVKALCVLDGDCSTSDIEGWIRSEIQGRDDIGNLQYVRLPGDGMPPEVWATEQINLQPYQAEFAKQLGCSMADTQVYIEAMKVELDPHNINYRLHCLTTLDPLDCMRRVIRSFAAQHPQLEGLRSAVSSALN